LPAHRRFGDVSLDVVESLSFDVGRSGDVQAGMPALQSVDVICTHISNISNKEDGALFAALLSLVK